MPSHHRQSFGLRFDPIAFIEQHGVVLASAKGPLPNLADAIAGEPIRGSWWGHKAGHEIFRLLEQVDDSADVLCFRLVDKKITFVHRRCWPALVRLAEVIGEDLLTAIKQVHTETGTHKNVLTPFPDWVQPETASVARGLSAADARLQLGAWGEKLQAKPSRRPASRHSKR